MCGKALNREEVFQKATPRDGQSIPALKRDWDWFVKVSREATKSWKARSQDCRDERAGVLPGGLRRWELPPGIGTSWSARDAAAKTSTVRVGGEYTRESCCASSIDTPTAASSAALGFILNARNQAWSRAPTLAASWPRTKGLSIRIQPKETFFLLNQNHSSSPRRKEP